MKLLVGLLLVGVLSGAEARAQPDCFADCGDGLSGLRDEGIAAGAKAPDFEGVFVDAVLGAAAPSTLELQLQGRPVLLVFGSYT
ncbi:MAG: hypothetical protein AAGK22_21725 [Acidobacteriota bacterium]